MPSLDEYRRRRDAASTPEPVPAEGPLPSGDDDVFVVQEHHASRLHWDVRLERGGVLVSFAVPKGLPTDPGQIRLAVHTEDHPLSYADFHGEIPKGQYGGGQMYIWDRGRYDTVKWSEGHIEVVLHGERVDGTYLFFRGGSGKSEGDWMVRRRDPPQDPDRRPLPDSLPPMLAVAGDLPPVRDDEQWSYEYKWDGVRALAFVEGGRLTLHARSGADITMTYPELRALGENLGSTQVLLDGEIVAFEQGRPSFAALQRRMHVSSAARARRWATDLPVTYLIFDLLHLDGHSCVELPYRRRRDLLERLELAGPRWQTPPAHFGSGADVVTASREHGLEGVIAKRIESPYLPGRRSTDWVKITGISAQEVVIGGWKPGTGRREGVMGALLLGIPEPDGLRFVGSVGTGFTDADLELLTGKLNRLSRKDSPFNGPLPRERAKDARWVAPKLVGEVVYREWTPDGRLRAAAWRGLRSDKSPGEVTGP
jgi:bifunctional non-homologous end joining protein LigD